MATAVLRVRGMSCDHCVRTVAQALEAVEGVERAEVDLKQGRAVVEYREGSTTPARLAGVVMDEGYIAEELA
ncbi:MAG: heavy-metal-associated domain-containing protein [Longimicrobiales bacterium]